MRGGFGDYVTIGNTTKRCSKEAANTIRLIQSRDTDSLSEKEVAIKIKRNLDLKSHTTTNWYFFGIGGRISSTVKLYRDLAAKIDDVLIENTRNNENVH